MSPATHEAAALRAALAPVPDAVDWLRLMELHSPLGASTRAMLGTVADELEALRAEVATLRAAPMRHAA